MNKKTLQKKKANKKDKIITVAEKLFSKKTFNDVSVDNIAKKAGVGKGTIYLYFKTKDELFLEMLFSGLNKITDLTRSIQTSAGTFEEKLLILTEKLLDHIAKNDNWFSMLLNQESFLFHGKKKVSEQWLQKINHLKSPLIEIFIQGQKEGRVRTDINPKIFTHFFWGWIREFTFKTSIISGLALTPEEVASIILNGVQQPRK